MIREPVKVLTNPMPKQGLLRLCKWLNSRMGRPGEIGLLGLIEGGCGGQGLAL
jgi:hypothetical protein